MNTFAATGLWDTGKLFKAPKWRLTNKATKPGMTCILYRSLPYKGRPVEVFSYYSAPDGKTPRGGWPAVVCVHGGGGTAFDAWVKIWNAHGYAAISMDLEGHFPVNKNDSTEDERLSAPNPGPARDGVFNDFNKPFDEQWYYHAVAQVILAHSLIRSFPEVNPDKTGITGISWGGNLTSTTMGIDTRFKFGIPVYGCGFLVDSLGDQGMAISKGKHQKTVEKYYDGSVYFHKVNYPTFWINGTNDFHFAMGATQKSFQAVNGPIVIRFEDKMPHSHNDGWNVEEIYVFADSVIKDGARLPEVGRPIIKSGVASVICKSTERIKSAKLYYVSGGITPKSEWRSIKADINDNKVLAMIPAESTAVFFNITDARNMMVSSHFVEIG